MEYSLLVDLGFFIAVFVVSFFGALSGGAGLVMRPLLIFIGVSPQYAIGTIRVGNVVSRLVGLTHLHRHGAIDWKLSFLLMIPATLGSIASVQIIVSLETEVLTRFIGFLILLSGIGMLFKRGKAERKPIGTPLFKSPIFGFISYGVTTLIGNLTGGGGVINNYLLLTVYEKDYISAAAIRKVAGFGGALIGSVLFIYYGFVNWHYVVIVLVAGSLGTYFGTSHGIKKGEEWVRSLVLAVVFVFGFKMLFF